MQTGFDNSVASPGFDYIDQIWAYNVTSDTWRNASASGGPSPRQGASAVHIGSKVWIYGGMGTATFGEPYLNTSLIILRYVKRLLFCVCLIFPIASFLFVLKDSLVSKFRISLPMILPPCLGQRLLPQTLRAASVTMQLWRMLLVKCGCLAATTQASHRCHGPSGPSAMAKVFAKFVDA